MKFLLAFDKLKGSMTAAEACAVVSEAIHKYAPNTTDTTTEVVSCPISDGGEGFAESMVTALDGKIVSIQVQDPLNRPVNASYGIINRSTEDGGKLAVMEMATASGLMLLTHPAPARNLEPIIYEDLEPLKASSYGTGQLIRHAIEEHQVDEIILGIGGSATNEGGFGCLQALGLKGYDSEGNEISGNPEGLLKLAKINTSTMLKLPKITIACDVENPLFGDTGAIRIFGKQKGVSESEYETFEKALAKFAYCSPAVTLTKEKGAGAAGGFGFGLLAFANATLTPGFDMIADTLLIKEKIANADVVITGEGSMDEQTLSGKGPAGIAQMAKDAKKTTVGLAGKIEPIVANYGLFDHCYDLLSLGYSVEETIAKAPELMKQQIKALLIALNDSITK